MGLIVLLTACTSLRAVAPNSAEIQERQRWVASAFEGTAKKFDQNDRPSLEVIENHDPVQRNARGGKPLRLGDKQYTSGLFCHANSRVVICNLPAPVMRFSAIIGVDSNEQTSGGRGSVKFIVRADGTDQYQSALVKEGLGATPIDLGFAGAHEVELIVTDGGDGIACDQADWADARITLGDGSSWNLGDLRIDDPADKPHYPTGRLFSFKVDGKPFDGAVKRTSEKLDANRVAHRMVWEQPDGLVARCEGVEYLDLPVVEWTVFLKNTAARDSGMIEELRAIDLELQRDAAGEFVLHHNTGSPCLPIDYQPHETKLAPGETKRITTSGGRSTNSDLPFFNIEQGGGRGTIVALGWPGQWAASFTRDSDRGLRVVAGQELTHFRLHPGEEVRTPLVVMQFYESGGAVPSLRAQNLWRRWMLAHNTPHPGGKSIEPMIGACSSHQFHEMIQADEASQKFFIDRYVEEKLGLNYWWMDAGWYVNNGDWPNTGTWEVDEKRFPRGLRAITDHAHEKGVKSIVWFEPERVTPTTYLYDKHPDWLLGKDGEQKLLNLGNEAARKWWTDHADELITKQGIDLYRTDYNIDPLPFWRAADADDRQGITEIRYVEGFLAYLDELRRRHPEMLIDTCASGGRRNDLETLRRAVPLLRSDYILEPVGQQNHTMGIAQWIPFYGTGVNSPDAYNFRSQMCPWITCCYDMRRKDLNYDGLRTRHEQWKQVSKFFLKDFYPLTPYATENTSWVAWQFDDPESGAGVVQVFRRAESFYESASLRLQGIDRTARYELSDFDADTRDVSGEELAKGLSVTLKKQPQAGLLTYRRR